MGKIIVIGNGDFADDTSNELRKYLMESSDKKRPRFLFFSAASDDDPMYIQDMKTSVTAMGMDFDELTVVRFRNQISKEFIRDRLRRADILFIGDGSAEKLLAILKGFNMDKMIGEFLNSGGILAGEGAGGIVFFNEVITGKTYLSEEDRISYTRETGLGFIPGIALTDGYGFEKDKLIRWFKAERFARDIPAWLIPERGIMAASGNYIRGYENHKKQNIKLMGYIDNEFREKSTGDQRIEIKDPLSFLK